MNKSENQNRRNFLFRAWNIPAKRWATLAEMRDLITEHHTQGENYHDLRDNRLELDNTGVNVLMQFTGLKDKKGKEIYEGDILKCDIKPYGHEFLGRIVFMNGGFCIDGGIPININGFGIEIVGNIYENPELLK
jgi:uncharacterized phage protein (TIGR01671 family)